MISERAQCPTRCRPSVNVHQGDRVTEVHILCPMRPPCPACSSPPVCREGSGMGHAGHSVLPGEERGIKIVGIARFTANEESPQISRCLLYVGSLQVLSFTFQPRQQPSYNLSFFLLFQSLKFFFNAHFYRSGLLQSRRPLLFSRTG